MARPGGKQKTINTNRKAKKVHHRFFIDCNTVSNDGLLRVPTFVNFLTQRIKVDGKLGNLGSAVTVEADKNKVVLNADVAFSKRYLKYLSKKYLKKEQLRDFLHVVATNKQTYEIRYFNIQNKQEEEE